MALHAIVTSYAIPAGAIISKGRGFHHGSSRRRTGYRTGREKVFPILSQCRVVLFKIKASAGP